MAFCGAEFRLQANLVGMPPVLRHRNAGTPGTGMKKGPPEGGP